MRLSTSGSNCGVGTPNASARRRRPPGDIADQFRLLRPDALEQDRLRIAVDSCCDVDEIKRFGDDVELALAVQHMQKAGAGDRLRDRSVRLRQQTCRTGLRPCSMAPP